VSCHERDVSARGPFYLTTDPVTFGPPVGILPAAHRQRVPRRCSLALWERTAGGGTPRDRQPDRQCGRSRD